MILCKIEFDTLDLWWDKFIRIAFYRYSFTYKNYILIYLKTTGDMEWHLNFQNDMIIIILLIYYCKILLYLLLYSNFRMILVYFHDNSKRTCSLLVSRVSIFIPWIINILEILPIGPIICYGCHRMIKGICWNADGAFWSEVILYMRRVFSVLFKFFLVYNFVCEYIFFFKYQIPYWFSNLIQKSLSSVN